MKRPRTNFWLSIATVLCTLSALAAEEPSTADKMERFLAACKQERPRAIDRQKQKIAEYSRWATAVKHGAIEPTRETKPPNQFNTVDEKQKALDDANAAVAHAKELLARYKSGESLSPPPLELPLKPGMIGLLDRDTAHVVRVVDGTTMLAELSLDAPAAQSKSWYSAVWKGSARKPAMVLALVRGVSTDSLHDNSAVRLPQVFEVAGKAGPMGIADVPTGAVVLDTFDVAAAEMAARERKK